ncbi:hypothetical protein LDENG_00281530, partial [Lucifuga dentata]
MLLLLVSLLPVALVSPAAPLRMFQRTDPHTGMSLLCDRCPPGTYMHACCTATSKTQCAPCPSGSFTELWNHISKCLRCGVCGHNQVVKSACKANSDCRCACKDGHYFHKKYDMCLRHSACPSGHGVLSI